MLCERAGCGADAETGRRHCRAPAVAHPPVGGAAPSAGCRGGPTPWQDAEKGFKLPTERDLLYLNVLDGGQGQLLVTELQRMTVLWEESWAHTLARVQPEVERCVRLRAGLVATR